MCKLCEKNSVYEFTNKRKLCKKCFITYFQKKILYTIRKFNMIKREDIIGYKKKNDFKGVVLEDALNFINERVNFNLVKLPIKKANKIAADSSIDSESNKIIKTLISGNVSELKKYLPSYGNRIKPLYLFLDEEILLYAKLKGLKFKIKKERKDKIKGFTDEFEEKHPEVKRAIVNSLLELYRQ
jgi:tRNA(Ile)-lysidine synthase TilS/MesJ